MKMPSPPLAGGNKGGVDSCEAGKRCTTVSSGKWRDPPPALRATSPRRRGEPAFLSTFGAALHEGVTRLMAAGVDTPQLDVQLLLAHAAGVTREAVVGYPERMLDPEAADAYQQAIARRARREPVSRITGVREFWGLPFRLSSETLDPRPDSETLIETVCRAFPRRNAALRILDLGTGSGCLLLALLHAYPAAVGTGVDISDEALATAAENAGRLGYAARAVWRQGDWTEGLSGAFDVIISNPPYIARKEIGALAPEVADFDPHRALDGGEDGLDAYRALIPPALTRLKENSALFLEIGAGQEVGVETIVAQSGGRVTGQARDLSGTVRCLTCVPGGA